MVLKDEQVGSSLQSSVTLHKQLKEEMVTMNAFGEESLSQQELADRLGVAPSKVSRDRE